MKDWFYSLASRDRMMLLVGAAALFLYLLIAVFFLGIYDWRASAEKRLDASLATYGWMQQAVTTIKQLGGGNSTGVSNVAANASLAQLAEMSAKKANLRLTRFQPKGDNEAQVWLDKVAFKDLLEFVRTLELDFALTVESLSINSAGDDGIVNARLKFKK
jgi:general secretion pathway protein M